MAAMTMPMTRNSMADILACRPGWFRRAAGRRCAYHRPSAKVMQPRCGLRRFQGMSAPIRAGRYERGGTRLSREKDFDEFYVGSVRKVTAQLVALLGDAGEADDAVQEAYARAWQR